MDAFNITLKDGSEMPKKLAQKYYNRLAKAYCLHPQLFNLLFDYICTNRLNYLDDGTPIAVFASPQVWFNEAPGFLDSCAYAEKIGIISNYEKIDEAQVLDPKEGFDYYYFHVDADYLKLIRSAFIKISEGKENGELEIQNPTNDESFKHRIKLADSAYEYSR